MGAQFNCKILPTVGRFSPRSWMKLSVFGRDRHGPGEPQGTAGEKAKAGHGSGIHSSHPHPKEDKELPLLLPLGLQQPRTTERVVSHNKNVLSFSPGGRKPEIEVRAAEPLLRLTEPGQASACPLGVLVPWHFLACRCFTLALLHPRLSFHDLPFISMPVVWTITAHAKDLIVTQFPLQTPCFQTKCILCMEVKTPSCLLAGHTI